MDERSAQATILWRRLDLPGHELCTLTQTDDGWRLTGVALFTHERRACRLEYDVTCDAVWETRRANIWGQLGTAPVALALVRTPQRAWSVNEVYEPALDGCVDIDLGFSPSTNLIPIRRLNLAAPQHAAVRAAWVRFPELSVEVLEQAYTRVDAASYRYESAGGAFVRVLTVDSTGFVVDYPGLWRAESRANS